MKLSLRTRLRQRIRRATFCARKRFDHFALRVVVGKAWAEKYESAGWGITWR